MTINSLTQLRSLLKENKKIFLLLYKADTEQSECAFQRISKIKSSKKFTIGYADVTKVPDIHPTYEITSAPSLLEFSSGKLNNVYKGCQTEAFYEALLSGSGFTTLSGEDTKAVKRVTVYTTPSCSWCTTIKTYFKEKNITYTEVNVAANPARAEEMIRKSGQQGVPQTDINGQMVIGFDKNRINQLLGIQ